MNNIYEILTINQISLPAVPGKGGIYTSALEFGDQFVYCSGCGPDIGDGQRFVGKLGRDLSLEDGQTAARNCVLNLLANLQCQLGDLNRIKRFVKVLAFVNCTEDFTFQPQVVDGASRLIQQIFGDDAGLPARSAIGTNALPGGIACEVEALIELYD